MTIRNDATRLRIPMKDARRPRAVVARQGLALLDTDLDQQSRHHLDRVETETADTLGPPDKLLVPAGGNGFKVTPGPNPAPFSIDAGHGYLGGWLLENASPCTLDTQPHPRTGDNAAAPAVVGLKSLVRYIDPVEDPALADAALRDAQASGRSLVDWQVFPFPLGTGSQATCASGAADAKWKAIIEPSSGTLAIDEKAGGASTDPCTLTPAGGYSRKENLNYRFEVHGGDPDTAYPDIDGPRFKLDKLQLKMSRRNASVLAHVTNVAGTTITVEAPPLDPRNWFAPGQYAELVSIHDDVDPRHALKTVRLYRVALAVDCQVILEEKNAGDIAGVGADGKGGWFLRLWDAFPDGSGLAVVEAPLNATASKAIDAGDGLIATAAKNKNGQATFRRGDYWTFDARADGSIGWPKTGSSGQAMTPHGPEVRYATIAAMNGLPGSITIGDCRVPFATLSDRILVYRGGDGQSIFSTATSGHVPLPAKLRVGVMLGENPVSGAAVKWSFVGPAGGSCRINGLPCDAANSPQTATTADGLAEVTWSIDAARQGDVHQVQATLVDAQGLVVPPLVFTATFETAAHTQYTPGKCAYLANVNNVQDAIDTLCSKIVAPQKPKVISLRSIVLVDQVKHPTPVIVEDVILNGLPVDPRAFVNGIYFGFDVKPDMKADRFLPIAEVELDLPYPATDPDRFYWLQASTLTNPANNQSTRVTQPFGFQRIRLDGLVAPVENVDVGTGTITGLVWRPTEQAIFFLTGAVQNLFDAFVTKEYVGRLKEGGWDVGWKPDRLLCRIRLRSAHIWAGDGRDRIYLNAEHLGTNVGKTGVELLVREVDPQRAADLEIFVYLRRG